MNSWSAGLLSWISRAISSTRFQSAMACAFSANTWSSSPLATTLSRLMAVRYWSRHHQELPPTKSDSWPWKVALVASRQSSRNFAVCAASRFSFSRQYSANNLRFGTAGLLAVLDDDGQR